MKEKDNKRILYVAQDYPPKINAGAVRSESIVNKLKSEGYTVAVFHENNVLCYKMRSKSMFNRVLNYLSFAFFVMLKVIFGFKKYDVCIISSPPPFAFITLSLLKYVGYFNTLIFDVRDVWMESVWIYSGKKNIIIKVFDKLIKRTYKSADYIISISLGMLEFHKQYKDEPKLIYIPNGCTITSNDVTKEKIVVFAGNFGLAYDFEKLEPLILNNKDYNFLFIGNGVNKDKIPIHTNVELMDFIQPKVLHNILDRCMFGVIPLKETTIFNMILPAKYFDMVSHDIFIISNFSKSMLQHADNIGYTNYLDVKDYNIKLSSITIKTENVDNEKLSLDYRIKPLLKILGQLPTFEKVGFQ